MFRPTGELAEGVFQKRYAIHPQETWEQACQRVANHVARDYWAGASRGTPNPLLDSTKYYEELVNGRFMPGGRIWFGAGRPQGQLLNCFVVPTEDSIEGWMKTVYDVGVISARGGGVGVNVSPVRPRGSLIKGNGGVSTGSVSLMQMINKVGDEIVGGGGRRMALMLDLDITHPDVLEFLNVKLDLHQLNNANISLVLNMDPEEFQRKVRNNEEIELEFDGKKTGQVVNAHTLWSRIVYNSWRSGEPGVLNGWLANQQSNIFYHAPLISTNPCGEIWLEAYGCCCLGALVLPRFVRDGSVDWQQLAHTVHTGVRFLDDVLDANVYPIPEVEKNCKEVRRLGLGVMGLHDMLLALGMKYSSPEALEFLDELFFFIKLHAYLASIDLARERGAFPAYSEEMLDSGFVKTLPETVRNGIKRFGIRNCALLTIAPTGTTSLVQGVSSGIEPRYAPVYFRNYWQPTPDGRKENLRTLVVDPSYEQYGDLVEGALDLQPRQHFEVQKVVQRHIDNAVSKTINLPEDYTVEDLAEVWLEYLPWCKGTTLYRSGSRGQEPLELVPHDQIPDVLRAHGYTVQADEELQSSMDCIGGVCDISSYREKGTISV